MAILPCACYLLKTMWRYILLLLIALATVPAMPIAAYPSNAQDSLGQLYFPLMVGNSWTYGERIHPGTDSVYTSSTLTVTDSSLVENTLSYKLESTHPRFGQYYGEFRIEDDSVLRLIQGDWVKWFDFGLEVGASYDIFVSGELYSQVTVEKKGVEVSTFAEDFSNCVVLRFDDPSASDDEVSYAFAPHVGVLYMSGAWSDEGLLSANVGGKVIPTATEGVLPSTDRPLRVNVFPNPSHGAINIEISVENASRTLMIHVYDILGRLRYSHGPVSAASNVVQIELKGGGFLSGTYYLVVSDGANSVVQPFQRY